MLHITITISKRPAHPSIRRQHSPASTTSRVVAVVIFRLLFFVFSRCRIGLTSSFLQVSGAVGRLPVCVRYDEEVDREELMFLACERTLRAACLFRRGCCILLCQSACHARTNALLAACIAQPVSVLFSCIPQQVPASQERVSVQPGRERAGVYGCSFARTVYEIPGALHLELTRAYDLAAQEYVCG